MQLSPRQGGFISLAIGQWKQQSRTQGGAPGPDPPTHDPVSEPAPTAVCLCGAEHLPPHSSSAAGAVDSRLHCSGLPPAPQREPLPLAPAPARLPEPRPSRLFGVPACSWNCLSAQGLIPSLSSRTVRRPSAAMAQSPAGGQSTAGGARPTLPGQGAPLCVAERREDPQSPAAASGFPASTVCLASGILGWLVKREQLV